MISYFTKTTGNNRFLFRFYIDYLNPVKVERNLVGKSEREKEGMKIREERRIDTVRKRVEKTITLERDSKTNVFSESVRLYSKDEMLDMLTGAGLIVKNVAGSIRGEQYSEDSDRMIIYGYKP